MSKDGLNLINWNTHKMQALAMPMPKGMRTDKSRISAVIGNSSHVFYNPSAARSGRGIP
jgi:hypothetical protein